MTACTFSRWARPPLNNAVSFTVQSDRLIQKSVNNEYKFNLDHIIKKNEYFTQTEPAWKVKVKIKDINKKHKRKFHPFKL